MAGKAKQSALTTKPSSTPMEMQQDLILLAYKEAEKQLRAGTASSQVITHFLKLGSDVTELEKEKIKQQNILMAAKTKEIEAIADREREYNELLVALRRYRGDEDPNI